MVEDNIVSENDRVSRNEVELHSSLSDDLQLSRDGLQLQNSLPDNLQHPREGAAATPSQQQSLINNELAAKGYVAIRVDAVQDRPLSGGQNSTASAVDHQQLPQAFEFHNTLPSDMHDNVRLGSSAECSENHYQSEKGSRNESSSGNSRPWHSGKYPRENAPQQGAHLMKDEKFFLGDESRILPLRLFECSVDEVYFDADAQILHHFSDDGATGQIGEQIAYNYILSTLGNGQRTLGFVPDSGRDTPWVITWVNRDRESLAPFDILCKNGEDIFYVEVKATKDPCKRSFNISAREIQFAQYHHSNYWVLFVTLQGDCQCPIRIIPRLWEGILSTQYPLLVQMM